MNRGEGAECQPRGPGAAGGAPPVSRGRLALIGGVLAALLAAALVAGALWKGMTLEDLRNRREAFVAYTRLHPVLSVEIYVAAYFSLLCLSLPGALIMSLAGGYLFGLAVGLPAALTALMAAALAMFAAGRGIMGDTLRRRLREGGGLAARLQQGLERNAFLSLLSLRLIPGLPFGLVNLAAAAVRIPTATYAGATLLGILPSTAVYVSTGQALVSAFSRSGAPKLSSLITPQVYLPLAGLAALSAAPLAWKAWRARRVRLAAPGASG